MKYIFILFLALMIFGCAPKNLKLEKKEQNTKKIKPQEDDIEIYDLVHLPQDINVYTKNIDKNVSFFDVQKKYEEQYFSVWNISKPTETLSIAKWPFYTYKVAKSYGENLQLLEQDFFDDMYENSNFDKYATINKNALTIKHSNIRAFPTNKPLIKDPSLAGEGFPFDYLQNSSIEANKPIFISHYSRDKRWVYVFSSFAFGWLQTSDIVFMKKKYTDLWQKAQQVFLVKDNIPIYSTDGHFLFNSKVGMMLALISEDSSSYTVLSVSNYKNSKPLFLKSKISKDIAHKGILSINKNNLENIISSVFNTNYGWGGMYGQRDCSSTIRDIFTPFGIWLPRNSSNQAKIGEVIDLQGLSDDAKIKLIKEKAIPFQTLLHKSGHIVLYVGIYKGDIVILHNTWGIKTKKDETEGRIIIGKTVFSTLNLGQHQKYYDKDASILRKLKSMNILTH